ncbi:Conserved_hypothetical protein [Hexamita inflata]|uniref:Uncharacterized protein n=1 Tax=Hexamita inflata TaxID=28002 RepID=A0AA86Q9Z2_9EUKA|nr:Conserved hypothetical protein [Hexamita inflata]
MESLNGQQLITYIKELQDLQDYNRLFDQVSFTLQKKYNHELMSEFTKLILEKADQLDISQKLKQTELYSLYSHNIHTDQNLLLVLQQYSQTLLNQMLKAILQNVSIAMKQIKSCINLQILINCPQNELTCKYLQAFFLPQYITLDQTRQILSQLSLKYSNVIEKCVLILPSFGAKTSACQYLIQSLNKVNPILIQHILQQTIKIKSANMFKQLFSYFSTIPELFTQLITQFSSSQSSYVRRNVCIILEQVFPTSQDALEIQAELTQIITLLLDNVPLVRQQAVITTGQLLDKFFTSLPNVQSLWDQLTLLTFDQQVQVRQKALEQLINLFKNADIKKFIIKTVQANYAFYKNLLSTNRKTKSLVIQLFCLIQQEDTTITQDINQFLLEGLNELNEIDSLFPQHIQTFTENPQFCYEQIFVGSQVCKHFLNKCLQSFVDQFGLEAQYICQLYYNQKEIFDQYEDDFVTYLNKNIDEEEIVSLGAMCHVFVQVAQQNFEQNTYLLKLICQILDMLNMLNAVGISKTVKQTVKDSNLFAIQGLTKEFQDKIQEKLSFELQLFQNKIISILKANKKRTFIQESNQTLDFIYSSEFIHVISDLSYNQNNKGLQLFLVTEKLQFSKEILHLNIKNKLFTEVGCKHQTILKEQIQKLVSEISSESNQFDLFSVLLSKIILKDDVNVQIDSIIRLIDFNQCSKHFKRNLIQILADLYQGNVCVELIKDKIYGYQEEEEEINIQLARIDQNRIKSLKGCSAQINDEVELVQEAEDQQKEKSMNSGREEINE